MQKSCVARIAIFVKICQTICYNYFVPFNVSLGLILINEEGDGRYEMHAILKYTIN